MLRQRVLRRRLRFIVCGSAPFDATLHAWFEVRVADDEVLVLVVVRTEGGVVV